MLEKGEGAFFTQTLNNSAFPFQQIQLTMYYEMQTEGQDGYNYWD